MNKQVTSAKVASDKYARRDSHLLPHIPGAQAMQSMRASSALDSCRHRRLHAGGSVHADRRVHMQEGAYAEGAYADRRRVHRHAQACTGMHRHAQI